MKNTHNNAHHLLSNCIGELGQQLDRMTGDKSWVVKVVEDVIETDYKALAIFKKWFIECRYELVSYTVKLTIPANKGKIELVNILRTSNILKFLRMWNAMSSLGRADNPEVDMVMDLDRLSPELVKLTYFDHLCPMSLMLYRMYRCTVCTDDVTVFIDLIDTRL